MFTAYKVNMKYGYPIPKTNAEGIALLWTKIYPAELARQLGVSRAAASKWKAVPAERVAEVSRITGLPKSHLSPELFADV
jgi:hypothetical protein